MEHAADELGRHRQVEQVDRSTTRIMGGSEPLDQEARDLGHKALGRIDIHESLCTERWHQQRLAMAVLQTSVDAMAKNAIGRVPAGIIATLTAMVGWLAARAFPIH